MSWVALPYGDPHIKSIKEKYKVKEIPTLVLLNH
jgi:hypothetical protein